MTLPSALCRTRSHALCDGTYPPNTRGGTAHLCGCVCHAAAAYTGDAFPPPVQSSPDPLPHDTQQPAPRPQGWDWQDNDCPCESCRTARFNLARHADR